MTQIKIGDRIGGGEDKLKVSPKMFLKMQRMRMLDKVDVEFVPPRLGKDEGFGHFIIKTRKR